MSRGSRIAPLLVALAVAGCAATAPSPRAPSRAPSATPRASEGDPPASVATRTPRPSPRPPESEEQVRLRIEQLDTADAGLFLEIASDGTALWYSAADPELASPDAAPLLYRYVPDTDAPELVWRSPAQDRSIVKIAGHNDTVAFADLDITPGDRSWNLWLLTEPQAEPILLDEYPGGEEVPGFVPSFDVDEGRIAWTSFDAGPSGPVSQLWFAEQPDWQPTLLASRPSIERELWLPSLHLNLMAFVEVVYSPDRSTDERHVLLMDLDRPDAEPRRLDTSGRATMPLVVADGVIWKETTPDMNMFSWGRLVHHTLADGRSLPLDLGLGEYNHPSVGNRFVTAWSIDSSILTVHDLERGHARLVERHPPEGPGAADRPHVAGDLLVWVGLEIDELDPGPPVGIRWTWLPEPGSDLRTGG